MYETFIQIIEDREPLNPSNDFPSYTRFFFTTNLFESLGTTSFFMGGAATYMLN